MQKKGSGHRLNQKDQSTCDLIFYIIPEECMNMTKWQCLECAYVYDPEKGDKTQNIPPGTPFEKLPKTWVCPECKISIQKKGLFVPRE